MRCVVRWTALGWQVTGFSRLTREAVVYATFTTWDEAMAWATGAEPRPMPRLRRLKLAALIGGGR